MALELDLAVPSGRIHAEVSGAPDAPLAIAVPGLSSNLRSFDFLVERIAGPELRVLAIDLRGRGRSTVGAAGTYGWPAHAADVIAVADVLDARTFSVIGQSMGALVGMEIARTAPGRIARAVFVDACGELDETTIPPIRSAVERLGTVFPSADGYIELVQRLGTIRPWSTYWERYFRYELAPAEGGVRARSDRTAVMEDLAYGETHHPQALWRYLSMPALLLRATQELMPGLGYIVPVAEKDAFLRDVPTAELVEVDANHYGINTHQESADAIVSFFRRHASEGLTTTASSTA